MRLLQHFGACDCHGHVYGPFDRFPLPPEPVFPASEAPVERLEEIWRHFGLDRAVLVQGSAYGDDHSAMLAAIAQSPERRRGVALLKPDVPEEMIHMLHGRGVRAVRLNWIHHLFGSEVRSWGERLRDAATLLKKVASAGWHVELHLTPADLGIVDELEVPTGMPVVIDHMARIDLSAPDHSSAVERLLRLLEQNRIWVKLSGADRLAANCERLEVALEPIREIVAMAPDRCVWGLDWPHVNLKRTRADTELADLLVQAAGSETTLKRILVENPAKLYGFADETRELKVNRDESSAAVSIAPAAVR